METNNQINEPKFEQSKPNWFLRHRVLYNVIAILSIVVIIGIIYLWQALKANQEVSKQLQDALSDQPASHDTSTWKTYANTQYGFEFKYPEDWFVEASQYNPNESIYIKPVNETASCFGKNIPPNCKIAVLIDSSSSGDLALYEKSAISKSIIVISGKDAERLTYSSNEKMFIRLNDKIILSLVNTDLSNSDVFDNLVSTFKFIQ